MSHNLLVPVNLALAAAPGANTNISGATFSPAWDGWVDITVQLATAAVLNVIETHASGTITHPAQLGVALVAAKTYTWSMPVKGGSVYNFQVTIDGIINRLLLHYVTSG